MSVTFLTNEDEKRFVKSVNGNAPDENGNVEIPVSGGDVDLTGYATEQFVRDGFQPKGNYLTAVPDGYAKTEDIPTKPEDIGAQPSGDYLTEVPADYATKEFVTNKIAEAELGGEEVDLSGYAQKSELPTKVSQLQNDSGYLTEHQSLEGYAKTEDIPKDPSDIGAQPAGNYALKTEIPSVPVKSVNGKTGAVSLSASDVGARPENWMPTAQDIGALPNTYTPPNQTAEQVGADPKGTATNAISQHNTADDSHGDIRLELQAINDRLTAFFDSDNQTLDELSEIVAYITGNKSLIDSITTSKVSVADIIDNLTTNVSNKPLSSAQGVVLKGLIDTLSSNLENYQPKGDYALRDEIPTVPSKVSAFTNDVGYLDKETDPTVPAWAKASSKPSYSKSEVGLGNVDNVKQYSASNPPPYPVASVNGKTGAVTLDAAAVGARPSTWMPSASDVGALPASTTIPTKTSQLTNDSGFINSYTETDPTVPSWAKATTKPSYSKSEVGLGNVDNVKQYSASNPPPYPVTSVNGMTGAVTVSVPTKVSQLQNDSGFLTEISKEEIVQQVIAALGTPVFGRIEDGNTIVLTGNLTEGTYTFAYEDSELNRSVIGTHTVAKGITNMIPLSINSDGSECVGANGEDGYKPDTRLNSSGAEATLEGTAVTGFIPVKLHDVVRFKNINFDPEKDSIGNYVALYDSTFTKIQSIKSSLFTSNKYLLGDYTVDTNGYLTSITVSDGTKDHAYLRISCAGLDATAIITVNEEIPD